MKKNFWSRLRKPFFCLAPMSDVTDAAFRSIVAKYGKPDVFWTEFTSADGLCSAGRERLLINLKYSRSERPIVAQLFGADPEVMREAASLVRTLGFDGVDINMGCPDRAIVRQGAGGALIKDKKLAMELVRAAREGVGDKIPVSVKTRIGYASDELNTWLPVLLDAGASAVTIHARTVKELSQVSARWKCIKKAVRIRDAMKSSALIIGNGDVSDMTDARKKARETGADGVMLGRAALGNPWLFARRKKPPTSAEKLSVLIEHTRLFERYFGKGKNFAVMKKHFKAYVSGFEGAKELRTRLMGCEKAESVFNVVRGVNKRLGIRGLLISRS